MLLFLPTGAAGKGFIEEMIRLVNSCTYKQILKNSIKGIDDYAWIMTSENLLEFKIKRKLWNTEAKIFTMEKCATRSTYVWGENNSQNRLHNNGRVTTNKHEEPLIFAPLIEEGQVNKARKILEKALLALFLARNSST